MLLCKRIGSWEKVARKGKGTYLKEGRTWEIAHIFPDRCKAAQKCSGHIVVDNAGISPKSGSRGPLVGMTLVASDEIILSIV